MHRCISSYQDRWDAPNALLRPLTQQSSDSFLLPQHRPAHLTLPVAEPKDSDVEGRATVADFLEGDKARRHMQVVARTPESVQPGQDTAHLADPAEHSTHPRQLDAPLQDLFLHLDRPHRDGSDVSEGHLAEGREPQWVLGATTIEKALPADRTALEHPHTTV